MKSKKKKLINKNEQEDTFEFEFRNSLSVQSKLKKLFSQTIEQMLEAEMEEHLGYGKHSVDGNNSGNSRNGYNYKKSVSNYGKTQIAIPRDRNGEFIPQALKKGETKTDELEHKIMEMYAKGLNQNDITDKLRSIYGENISSTLIEKITDKIIAKIAKWQNRPLQSTYPIVYFDEISFKNIANDKIMNKHIYSILGIDLSGNRDILAIWITESKTKKFFTSVFTELKSRGVQKIIIACHSNLTEFSDAISELFPETQQQSSSKFLREQSETVDFLKVEKESI